MEPVRTDGLHRRFFEVSMKLRRLALFALLLLPVACASGGRGESAAYRRDLGNASASDTWDFSHRIINRYQYDVLSQDSVSEIRIETHWKSRRPFADELSLGVTAAESRLVIVARPRGQSELGAVYNNNLSVDNRIRLAGGTEWNEVTNTALFRQYADEIVSEFKREIQNVGVRRY
jgi:hypothetical protein